MQQIIDKIENLQNEYASMKNTFCESMKQSMKEFFVEFFNENPSINAVIWTQYTPYFNDGDECVFSVSEPCFTNASSENLNDVSPWGEYEGDNDDIVVFTEWEVSRRNSNIPDFIKSLQINVRSIEYLSSMLQSENMSDIMLETFGDHCRVTATRDGFEIVEYEHD